MNRQPVVNGKFYPASPSQLSKDIQGYLGQKKEKNFNSLLAMVPHAGIVFSGSVAGQTLAQAGLQKTVVLIGPNHTGRGQPAALWPDGCWEIPGANVPVNTELAKTLLAINGVQKDYEAHLFEHSLEVILPFLHQTAPETSIVPLCLSNPDPQFLLNLGSALAQVIKSWKTPVSLVISSDMSHFLSLQKTKEQDSLALAQILALSPLGLYEVVRQKNISMCGVLPMVAGLQAARELGATSARLCAYATSGDITGDYQRVVGYAGVLVGQET